MSSTAEINGPFPRLELGNRTQFFWKALRATLRAISKTNRNKSAFSKKFLSAPIKPV